MILMAPGMGECVDECRAKMPTDLFSDHTILDDLAGLCLNQHLAVVKVRDDALEATQSLHKVDFLRNRSFVST